MKNKVCVKGEEKKTLHQGPQKLDTFFNIYEIKEFIISSVCLLQINKKTRNNYKIMCKEQYEESHRV